MENWLSVSRIQPPCQTRRGQKMMIRNFHNHAKSCGTCQLPILLINLVSSHLKQYPPEELSLGNSSPFSLRIYIYVCVCMYQSLYWEEKTTQTSRGLIAGRVPRKNGPSPVPGCPHPTVPRGASFLLQADV